jgi:hypothetical protein
MREVEETPFSDDEFKELHRIVQQAALAAYPNPERKGCPGAQVLSEMARISWPAKHPGYDHVKHCSPCLREMLDMREEIILARTRSRNRRYRIGIAAGLVLAASLIIVATLTFTTTGGIFLERDLWTWPPLCM